MSENLSAKPQRRSLQDFFEQIETADNPELEFINLVLNSALQKDGELPGLLRACAIPRRFDEHIIGVLRSKPDDQGQSARSGRGRRAPGWRDHRCGPERRRIPGCGAGPAAGRGGRVAELLRSRHSPRYGARASAQAPYRLYRSVENSALERGEVPQRPDEFGFSAPAHGN